MKILANIVFGVDAARDLHKYQDDISIDANYVESDKNEVIEYVKDKLTDKYDRFFEYSDFEIVNLGSILEDLDYSDFFEYKTKEK